MSGLNWSKLPGLICAVFLHVLGVFFLVKATNLDCNAIGRAAALQRQLEGSDYRYDPAIRESEVKCNQNMTIHIWASMGCWFFSLAGLAHTIVLLRRRNKLPMSMGAALAKTQDVKKPLAEPDLGLFHSIKDGLAELESALKQQSAPVAAGISMQIHQHNIKMLQSQTSQTCQILMNSHSLLGKGLTRVQALVAMCRESANFTASNRIEWKKNNLSGVLSQIRQNHDQLLDRSKSIASMHASTMRLLHEAILSEKIIHQKVNRIEEKLKEVQSGSFSVHKTIEKMVEAISESREDVHSASKLVNSYKQKSENMGVVLSRIDELVEKMNRHMMSMSLEYARNSDAQNDYFSVSSEIRSLAVEFHNYTIQLKEYVDVGQPELDKAQHFLLEAGQKSEHAFVSVKRIEEAYRNDVAAAKYAISDLSLLSSEVHIHMTKLNETRDLGDDTSRISQEILVLLDAVGSLHRRFNEESGHITLQCEKLSNLLTKQHFELGHCEKLLMESSQAVASAIRHANETKQNAATWVVSMSQTSIQESRDPGSSLLPPNTQQDNSNPLVEEVIVHKIADFKKMVARLEQNLEAAEPEMKSQSNPNRVPKVTLASVGQ
jgi:methyl-accepting chemotaxis protein